MPTVRGKHYPYTPAGKRAAARARKSGGGGPAKAKGGRIANLGEYAHPSKKGRKRS